MTHALQLANVLSVSMISSNPLGIFFIGITELNVILRHHQGKVLCILDVIEDTDTHSYPGHCLQVVSRIRLEMVRIGN